MTIDFFVGSPPEQVRNVLDKYQNPNGTSFRCVPRQKGGLRVHYIGGTDQPEVDIATLRGTRDSKEKTLVTHMVGSLGNNYKMRGIKVMQELFPNRF